MSVAQESSTLWTIKCQNVRRFGLTLDPRSVPVSGQVTIKTPDGKSLPFSAKYRLPEHHFCLHGGLWKVRLLTYRCFSLMHKRKAPIRQQAYLPQTTVQAKVMLWQSVFGTEWKRLAVRSFDRDLATHRNTSRIKRQTESPHVLTFDRPKSARLLRHGHTGHPKGK